MITNLAARLLLEQNPAPPAQGPEFGGSSPVGLVVTLLLFIALIVLIRSMNKHLRKVPASFDPPEQEPASGSTPRAGSAGSVSGRRTPARDSAPAGQTSPAGGTPVGEGTPASGAGGPGAGGPDAGPSTDDRG
jgi:hypothetical protein